MVYLDAGWYGVESFSWVHCDRWGCRRGTSVNGEWPEDLSQYNNSEGHVPGCDSSPSSKIRIWWKGWLVALRCYECSQQIWQAYWAYRGRDADVTNCECPWSWVSRGHVTETWCLRHGQEEDVVVRAVLRQARSGTKNSLPARWREAPRGQTKWAALVTSWENEGVPHRSNCPASAASWLEYQRSGLLRQLPEGYRARRIGECKRPRRRCQTLLGWIPRGENGCCVALPFCELQRYNHNDGRQQLQPSHRQ